MNQEKERTKTRKRRATPLSVWELPKLLAPVHRYRKARQQARQERPHFKAILAFVHRNRFAVAGQIQRRFPQYLRSDRTARRHKFSGPRRRHFTGVFTIEVQPD